MLTVLSLRWFDAGSAVTKVGLVLALLKASLVLAAGESGADIAVSKVNQKAFCILCK